MNGTGVIRGVVTRDARPTPARITGWIAWASTLPDGEEVPFVDGTMSFGCHPIPSFQVEAGPDGAFAMSGLREGTYRLEAVTADGVRGSGTAWTDDDEPLQLRISPNTHTLRGRAVLLTGASWTGLLSVCDSDYPGDLPAPVITDSDGRFRVAGLREREVRLVAAEPRRRLVAGPSALLPCEEEVVFVVGDGWREAEGFVLSDSDGSPVPGARVAASFGERGDDGRAQATTDSNGRFLIEFPEGSEVDLEVSAPGFAAEKRSWSPAERPDLRIRLRRSASLTGRVVDVANHAPVAGVTLHYFPGRLGRAPGHYGGYRTTSGSEGRFAMTGLPPGEGQVLAIGEGRILREAAAPGGWDLEACVLTLSPGITEERDLVVVPAPGARGTVRDTKGSPVSGASVAALKPGVYDGSAEYLLWDSDPSESDATTDRDGVFSFPVLIPGLSYGFVALKEGIALAGAGPFRAEAGRVMEVTVTIPDDRRIHVRVESEESKEPVAGAIVQAKGTFLPGETIDLLGEVRTGPDGTASVGPLPAAPVQLLARRAGGGRDSEPVELVEGAQEPVVLTLPAREDDRRDITVEGSVLLPDGSPASGARLTLWSSSWGCMRYEPLVSPRTDFRGRFRLVAPGGSVHLEATLWRGGQKYSAFVNPDVEGGAEAVRGLVLQLKVEEPAESTK